MSRLLRQRFTFTNQRLFTTTTRALAYKTGPAPPRLPPKEQEEFEKLQKASTGAFSTPRGNDPTVVVNQTLDQPASPPRSRPQINQSPQSSSNEEGTITNSDADMVNARVQATGDGKELHPDIRRGARPEFEGDRNPITGESGGPKNEPLRWGSTEKSGDWSYNGRVTDF